MRITLQPSDEASVHRDTRRFRILLEAFGYPARRFDMGEPAGPALIAALCDEDTPLAVTGRISAHAPALRHVPLTSRERAAFIMADAEGFQWQDLPCGTAEAPETAATVILDMPCGQGARLRATGAGIREQQFLDIDAQTATTLALRPQWPSPLGVDLILIQGHDVIALPRHLSWEIV